MIVLIVTAWSIVLVKIFTWEKESQQNLRRDFRVDELVAQNIKTGGLAFLHCGNQFIYYLVTKAASHLKPSMSTLQSSLTELKQHCLENDIKRLAMPMIGCGLDQLDWEQVKEMLNLVFCDTEVRITVYKLLEQQGSKAKAQPDPGFMTNTTETIGRLSSNGEKADEANTTRDFTGSTETDKTCTILPGEQTASPTNSDSYIQPAWSKAELRQLQDDDHDVREVIELMANGGTKPNKDTLKGKS